MTSCLDLLSAQSVEEMDRDEYGELLAWTQEAMRRLESSVAAVLRHAEAPQLAQGDYAYPLVQLAGHVKRVAAGVDIAHCELFIEDDCADTPAATPDPAWSHGDLKISEAALECILTELFDNAKKFHPRREPSIRVCVQRILGADGVPRARLRVTDDGVNLSPVQLEKMWTPYYQSERSFTGEVPGMGLGLSLVQRLLWQVGGNCTSANRADGPGLEVEIVLPMTGV
jgi:signal transduction histidine kinase